MSPTEWTIRFTKQGQKSFERLDKPIQQQIRKFLRERLMQSKNPRVFGKQLAGNLSEFWRYRVGDYRILCTIEDSEFLVLVVLVMHRRDVYN